MDALIDTIDGLDQSELVYHQQILTELKKAQETAQQANVDLVKAQGAVDSWTRFLMSRYGLNEGDSVNEQGQFTRKAAP